MTRVVVWYWGNLRTTFFGALYVLLNGIWAPLNRGGCGAGVAPGEAGAPEVLSCGCVACDKVVRWWLALTKQLAAGSIAGTSVS